MTAAAALGPRTRRRLALYGGAGLLGAILLLLPGLAKRYAARVEGLVDLAAVESAKKSEAADLLVRYVKIDTTNPPGRTREAVAFVAERLDCEGIGWEITGDDPERPILVARLPGRRREGALMLLHHADVFPPGDLSKWAVPPFAGEYGKSGADRSFLYGRGTIDMKDIGVAHLLAVASLKREGIVPERDLLLVVEPSEETFNPEAGVGWLFTHRPDLVAGVTDVLTEGGVNECLGRSIDRFGIEVLQKANLGYRAAAKSRGPLEELKAFLEARDKELPYRILPEVREYFRFVGPSRGDVWGRLVLDPERVLRGDVLDATMPDVYRGLLKDSIYCGSVEADPSGGFFLEFLWTLLPGSPVAAARERTLGWLSSRPVTLEARVASADSIVSPRTGPAWEAVVRSLQLDPTGAEVGIYILNGSYTNSSWLRAHGIRSYGVSPFDITIFDAARAHNPSERIHVTALVEGVERMKRIVREWATAP